MSQCLCQTGKGVQCRRVVKEGHQFCHQHSHCKKSVTTPTHVPTRVPVSKPVPRRMAPAPAPAHVPVSVSAPIVGCNFNPSGLKLLGQGEDAIVYTDGKFAYKVIRGDCTKYHYDNFIQEVKNNHFVTELLNKGVIHGFVPMVSFVDCCQGDQQAKKGRVPAIVVYPLYQQSMEDYIRRSKAEDSDRLRQMMWETITNMREFSAVTGMTHGDFNPKNILLDQANRPVITDYGTLKPSTKEEAEKEIADFFYNFVEEFANGDFDNIKRPWLYQIEAELYRLKEIPESILQRRNRQPVKRVTNLDWI